MKKKKIEVYEAPKTEIVELGVQSIICGSQLPGMPETDDGYEV